MAGFVDVLRNMFNGAANGAANMLRDRVLTPAEIEARDNGKRLLEMVKLASIVAGIGFLFLFGIFPNLFTALLTVVVAFSATEVYEGANNTLEIFNQATVEATARMSKENLLNQISKDTLLLGPFLKSLDLDVSPLLFG